MLEEIVEFTPAPWTRTRICGGAGRGIGLLTKVNSTGSPRSSWERISNIESHAVAVTVISLLVSGRTSDIEHENPSSRLDDGWMMRRVYSEHCVVVLRRLRDWLNDVPVLYDLAVFQTEEVYDGVSSLAWILNPMAVQDDHVSV